MQRQKITAWVLVALFAGISFAGQGLHYALHQVTQGHAHCGHHHGHCHSHESDDSHAPAFRGVHSHAHPAHDCSFCRYLTQAKLIGKPQSAVAGANLGEAASVFSLIAADCSAPRSYRCRAPPVC